MPFFASFSRGSWIGSLLLLAAPFSTSLADDAGSVRRAPDSPYPWDRDVRIGEFALALDQRRVLATVWDHTPRRGSGPFIAAYDVLTGKILERFEQPLVRCPGNIKLIPGTTHALLWREGKVLRFDFAERKTIWEFAEREHYGHGSLVLSPDGRYCIIGAQISTCCHDVYLWDTKAKKRRWASKGHVSPFCGFAFTPDSKRVVSYRGPGFPDAKQCIVFGVTTGKEELVLQAPSNVSALAVSPTGDVVAAACHDGPIVVWDLKRGRIRRAFNAFPKGDPRNRASQAYALTFTPTGTYLLSGGWYGLRLWELATGKLAFTFTNHDLDPIGINDVAVTADGRRVVTNGWFNGVEFRGQRLCCRSWDLVSGEELATLEGGAYSSPLPVTFVALAPDGRTILTRCGVQGLDWSEETGELLWGGRQAYMEGKGLRSDAYATLWNAQTGEVLRELGSCTSVVFAPGGKHVLRAFDLPIALDLGAFTVPYIQVVEVNSDKAIRGVPISQVGSSIHTLLLSQDEKHLVTVDRKRVRVLDYALGRVISSFDADPEGITFLALTRDGRVVSESKYGVVRDWELETGKLLRRAKAPLSALQRSEIIKQSRGFFDEYGGIALGSNAFVKQGDDGFLALHDLTSEKHIRTFGGKGTREQLRCAVFSEDGKQLITGGDRQTLKLWNVEKGQEIRTLRFPRRQPAPASTSER